ncbi:MAG: hypothetical protein JO303_02890 [Caulobacteraceae bacterium]|nr:hypothetical protein [Caulobacteraceae bacterium]
MSDFLNAGRHIFPEPLDAVAASELLGLIRADRAFDSSLFLSQAAFDADPQYVGVNPRPGRNLLDRFADRLGFVEQAPPVVAALSSLLGEDYQILGRKIVCGVPESAVPPWLRARIKGNAVNNLGAFVRPELRDVTYFYGLDFHQDLIDYKDRAADFVTLYVYLHPVTAADAPLYLLEGSHQLGATVFPHDLTPERTPDAEPRWTYGDRRGQTASVRQKILTGGTGYAAVWHACTLHGTQPDAADHERISLRYLLARGSMAHVGLDQINAALRGPLSLAATRDDLAEDGSARIRGNIVNQARRSASPH